MFSIIGPLKENSNLVKQGAVKITKYHHLLVSLQWSRGLHAVQYLKLYPTLSSSNKAVSGILVVNKRPHTESNYNFIYISTVTMLAIKC